MTLMETSYQKMVLFVRQVGRGQEVVYRGLEITEVSRRGGRK